MGPSIWNKLSSDLKIFNTATLFTHNNKKFVNLYFVIILLLLLWLLVEYYDFHYRYCYCYYYYCYHSKLKLNLFDISNIYF